MESILPTRWHGLKIAPKAEAANFYGEKQDFRLLTAKNIEECRNGYLMKLNNIIV